MSGPVQPAESDVDYGNRDKSAQMSAE